MTHFFPEGNQVMILRYDDPVRGPLKIPAFGDEAMKGKSVLSKDTSFLINVDKKEIAVQQNGSVHNVGTQMIYIVS